MRIFRFVAAVIVAVLAFWFLRTLTTVLISGIVAVVLFAAIAFIGYRRHEDVDVDRSTHVNVGSLRTEFAEDEFAESELRELRARNRAHDAERELEREREHNHDYE